MAFLYYLIVLALTKIQSIMSQEGNFAQFGDNAGDARFTQRLQDDSEAMRGIPRYIKWGLPMHIPGFGENKVKDILVSRCFRLNIDGVATAILFQTNIAITFNNLPPCRIKIYFCVQYKSLNNKAK